MKMLGAVQILRGDAPMWRQVMVASFLWWPWQFVLFAVEDRSLIHFPVWLRIIASAGIVLLSMRAARRYLGWAHTVLMDRTFVDVECVRCHRPVRVCLTDRTMPRPCPTLGPFGLTVTFGRPVWLVRAGAFTARLWTVGAVMLTAGSVCTFASLPVGPVLLLAGGAANVLGSFSQVLLVAADAYLTSTTATWDGRTG